VAGTNNEAERTLRETDLRAVAYRSVPLDQKPARCTMRRLQSDCGVMDVEDRAAAVRYLLPADPQITYPAGLTQKTPQAWIKRTHRVTVHASGGVMVLAVGSRPAI
jgi:hypothetical protein